MIPDRLLRRLLLLICLLLGTSVQAKVLIPMDSSQRDHLKAYGVAYWTLSQGVNVEWLLNYRGGAFLCDGFEGLLRELRVRGVTYSEIGGAETATIYAQIESSNMERILLEKAPKVAIYTPPESQPWDDAVTMALKYAEIEYDTVYDREVLRGDLKDYDWLHLHHEDFTGQYGKFYGSYATAPWYIEQQRTTEALAAELGFKKVSRMRLAVSLTIRDFIEAGGFLFAMCSATDSYDIALAAMNTDICASVFDGDPPAADAQARLDYSQCLAFKDFIVDTNPMIYEYSDIDASPQNGRSIPEEQDWFSLFEFSAKWDPVPTMLTQNHTAVIHGFMGQTTAFRKDRVKDNVIVMGEIEGGNEVRYLHGVAGKGSFTFYGGHDPEDYRHRVGDPETQLTLHRNSPGYRLILNNILFPAAKKQKQKT